MNKLMIGLVAVFVVACSSESEEVSHLDAQLTHDGIYGTYSQGELNVEFASFESQPGLFAVTIIGNDFAIDTFLLPPGSSVPVASNRPTDVVDFGASNSGGSDPGFGAFLLPPGSTVPVASNRPTDVVDFGTSNNSGPGFGLGTFLLPPGSSVPVASNRPTDVVDFGPGSGSSGRDLSGLGRVLRERYPDQPAAVTALLGVVDPSGTQPVARE